MKNINILQSFPGISSLLFCILFFSCNAKESKKPGPPDIAAQLNHKGYDDRINNLFSFIDSNKFDIPPGECNNIIILQTNLCNSCNEEKLNTVFDSLNNKVDPVYFILADNNPEVKNHIQKFNKAAVIFIDTLHLLQKYNLSFLRNIQVNTCNKKIIHWSFI